MLDWAKATFNSLGPINARGLAAGESLLEMLAYARGVERAQLWPNGWAARLFDAVDKGEIAAADVASLLIAYIAPSLDTTILGAWSLLYMFGSHPDEYDRVRANPALISAAVNEVLRFESPVRADKRFEGRIEGPITLEVTSPRG